MENDKPKVPKQICTITVVFPADSDEDAIVVKKKIDEAASDIADSRIDFRIMKMGPPRV